MSDSAIVADSGKWFLLVIGHSLCSVHIHYIIRYTCSKYVYTYIVIRRA